VVWFLNRIAPGVCEHFVSRADDDPHRRAFWRAVRGRFVERFKPSFRSTTT
jgi:hypothetical protein